MYRALVCRAEMSDRRNLCWSLESAAMHAAASGDARSAAWLAGAASRQREDLGTPLPPLDGQSLRSALAPALDADQEHGAQQELAGRLASHDQALEVARRVLAPDE